jgi:hypothetical protein
MQSSEIHFNIIAPSTYNIVDMVDDNDDAVVLYDLVFGYCCSRVVVGMLPCANVLVCMADNQDHFDSRQDLVIPFGDFMSSCQMLDMMMVM